MHTLTHDEDRGAPPAPARSRWPVWRGGAVLLLAGGLAFQLLHTGEHMLQLSWWVAHPGDAPYLTPWAVAARDALAMAAASAPALGNELLHLLGNGLYVAVLLGLLALDDADTRAGLRAVPPQRTRLLRAALLIEAAHLAEHVLLTASVALAGRAWGVSTLFGALADGRPSTIAFRVWLHAVLNVVPTVLAVRALLVREPVAQTALNGAA